MFSEVIKQALKNKKRNATWLSDEMGFPKQSVYYYLRVGRGLSLARVERIFKFLGITLNVPEE